MDFDMGSRMLVHAVIVLSCASTTTLNGRFEVFEMFGFSKTELASMFRKSPPTFGLSEANLRKKLEFFLNNIKINRLVLVGYLVIFCCSLEKRSNPSVPWSPTGNGLVGRAFLENFIIPSENDVKELVACKAKFSK